MLALAELPKVKMRILLCLFLLIVSYIKALANPPVEESFVNELKGAQVAVNNFFYVSDEKFNNSTYWNLIEQNYTVSNIITFEINFDTTIFFYNTPFACTLNFKIYLYGNQSDTSQVTDSTTHSNVSLIVRYDTVTGKPYKGIAMYKFSGSHKYRVKILGITSAELTPTIPAIFRLKGQIVVDRHYKFQDGSTDLTRFSVVNTNQLKLEWTPSSYQGASEFDLEYTHIDSSSQIGSSIRSYYDAGDAHYYIPADSLAKWFKNNNTRITTAASSYLLNIPYDSGYVLFRIRGVQDSLGVRIEGDWNYKARKTTSSFDCTSDCPVGAIFFAGHETLLNWQYSVVFAEEGKRKEVISYFDGTLRNRQSVTLTNSDNKNVVQETIYDALGRPAANILPAPTNDSTIHYFRGFNKNSGGTNPYSFSDLGYSFCVTDADSVSHSSGAGKYYSTSNVFQGTYYYAKHIPNAGGYPLTVTEYMADNTGRIKAQSGVGPMFQLGNGHETRYFYGKPNPKELYRLFGTEAGNADHYLKNMVVDPNGQISVSYMDASGKTVATALAGGVPANMHALPSSSGASVNVTNELIKPTSFARNPGDYSLTATATFLAPVTGTYIFNYEIEPLVYRKLFGPDKDSVICSNCYYDLEITIKDDCENLLRRDTVAAGTVFDTTCSDPPDPIEDSMHVSINKIGEYYVTYSLKVSRDALTFYDSVHLVKNSDIKKLNYFLLEELKQTDFYGCYSDCRTCLDKLGTKAEFTANFESLYVADSINFSTDDSTWVAGLYDSLYANCQSMQSECGENVCDEKLDLLKRDVSPGGQYGLYDSSYNLLETPINRIAMRDSIIWFPDEFGNRDSVMLVNVAGEDSIKVDVKQLNDSNFIKHWRDSWADSLVRLHPEYCFYLWCIANSNSYDFDRRVEDMLDADTADAYNWFDPADYKELLDADPFFNGGGNGASLYNRMKDSLRLFSRTYVGFAQTDKNILQFIDLILYCKYDSSCHVWDSCTVDNDCRSRNREWYFYKQFYLNLKQKFYEVARLTHEDFEDCRNCFIGKDLLGYVPGPCVDTCYNNNFQKSYGGTGDDFSYDIKTTKSGGIVVAGKTNSFGAGGYDGYVIKLNNKGEVQWSKTVGGSDDDEFRRIKQTSDGGYIAIGTTQSYGTSSGTILVTRFYANGTIAWSKEYGTGTDSGDEGRDISQTSDGGFILCGAANAISSPRLVLIKINSAGTISWSKKYESGAVAQAMDIMVEADTAIVSGYYYTGSTNYNDAFLMKVNHTNGSITWVKGYEIAGLNNIVSQIDKRYDRYYFKSISTPSTSNLIDSTFTVLSTDRSGAIQVKKNIITSTKRAGSFFPDDDGNIVIGQNESPSYNSDVLYYYKMDPSGSFINQFSLPKLAGYAVIEKAVKAPGKTAVFAGAINPNPGVDDDDIYIFKTSADTSDLTACGTAGTTDSTSEASVTTSTLSWTSSNVTYGGTTTGSGSPSTVTDTICSYFACHSSGLDCDTITWQPFIDTLCTSNTCSTGTYNPYDRDSISFYVEYGNPNDYPTGVPSGYAGCRFYSEFVVHTGASTVCRFTNVWVCVKDSTCPGGVGVCYGDDYPSSCEPSGSDSLYKNKVRRYPEYVNTSGFMQWLSGQNPQQGADENLEDIAEQCTLTCDAQADLWMTVLQRCNMSSGDSTALRAALVEICTNGCSVGNPFGTSSVPGSVSITYHSFEEAIEGILGPGAINDSCTQELLAMPYPYDKQPAYTDQLITETNAAICAKLYYYDTAWQNSGYTGSFHSWLKLKLGSSYTLDSLELDDLINSCENCNYILKNDIILPVPLMPDAPPCLTCDSVSAALTAFEAKFPALDPSDDDYEALFTNFFNHRFGYSLSYYVYKNYMDSCDAHSPYTVQLCDQPMQQDILYDDSFDCTAELYKAALTNAWNRYVVYIDSVRKDFQEAWLTKCMNVQPSLTMTADLYEYHYTLFYYDQSGNLVKTVPPEGVQLLDNSAVDQIVANRNGTNPDCSNRNGAIFNGGTMIFTGGINAPHLYVGTQPFSIEYWVKLGSYSDQGILSNEYTYTSGGPIDFGYSVQIKNSRINLIMGENYTPTTGIVEAQSPVLNSYIPLSTWAHVVVERVAINAVRMFINGNEVPVSYVRNSPITGNLNSTVDWGFYIGSSFSGGTTTYMANGGGLRHVRIYKRALTATEIRQNAANNCGTPASSESLVFWEPFTEGRWTPGYYYGYTDFVYDRIYNHWGFRYSSVAFETADTALVPAHRMVTTYQYNSLNQVLQQYSPDGDTSKFYYDRLGRLIVGQNKEQKHNASYSGAANRYSYTLYDSLGRIKEVGEKSGADSIHTIDLLDTADVNTWLASGTDRQITRTIYDNPVNLDLQDYNTSRKRVVASIYIEEEGDSEGDSTLYNYDILGNVKTLVQHVKRLVAVDAGNGRKRVDYSYDVVSGKVNMVSYQHEKGDQFYYKYSYDADNRVTRSYSSRDRLVWIEDASYNYYLHGPLARTELGHYKVQGTDYAYTLQGWLKGINSDSLNHTFDIAGDGWQNTTYGRVSRDVYGFKLGYYNSDYTPIGGSGAPAFSKKSYTAPTSPGSYGDSLFNGNISFTTLALNKINGGSTVGYCYGYDQLNRLVEMRQHTTGTTSGWSNSNVITAYRESISYDANGNILKYLRKGNATTPHMDSLTYKYTYSSGNLVNNKLNHVKDSIPGANYTVDIDNQDADNYTYDYVGNLISDGSEGIDTIRWTVYGKINRIAKRESDIIEYAYDPRGNRTWKQVTTPDPDVTPTQTFYIRDAQGNVLAVYELPSAKVEGDPATLLWKEQHLYGSSRLGMWRVDTTIPGDPPVVIEEPIQDSLMLGSRNYELTNHLGNVLAVISDKKVGNDSSGVVNYYIAEVLSQNDYYPGGMDIPGRHYNATSGYRYGFNGKEKDTEGPVQYDYGFRIYDPRLVRFKSVDPLFHSYPWYTPYQFAGNMPIWAIDLDGLEEKKSTLIRVNKIMDTKGNLIKTPVTGISDGGEIATITPGETVLRQGDSDGVIIYEDHVFTVYTGLRSDGLPELAHVILCCRTNEVPTNNLLQTNDDPVEPGKNEEKAADVVSWKYGTRTRAEPIMKQKTFSRDISVKFQKVTDSNLGTTIIDEEDTKSQIASFATELKENGVTSINLKVQVGYKNWDSGTNNTEYKEASDVFQARSIVLRSLFAAQGITIKNMIPDYDDRYGAYGKPIYVTGSATGATSSIIGYDVTKTPIKQKYVNGKPVGKPVTNGPSTTTQSNKAPKIGDKF